MRVAILALFPVHVIPGFEGYRPNGHYATWLPQLSAAWEGEPNLDLHWITISRAIKRSEPVRWRNQTFHFIHVPDRLRVLRLYGNDCRLVTRKLEELRPNLIHAWGSEDCYGLAAARSGRPFLLSMQGILTEYARLGSVHPFERIQAWIERYILKRARHVTAESAWGCRLVQKLQPKATVHQVEYGVQKDFFQIGWRPNLEKPAAVFVGTPTPRKGLQDLVEAFTHPSLAQAELWVIGDRSNAYAQQLERRSTSNVKWLGRLDPAATASRMAEAWCLVLPTRADTSPNVVKEARVIGLPVITTPHGGQADYIIDGETGWLVEPEDIACLTDRIARTLGDLVLAQRLGSCRHEEQRAWFRPENTAQAFLDIYRQLAR